MFVNTYHKAVQQALANAKYFGEPYDVFTDTSGNFHVERATISPVRLPRLRCYPDGRREQLQPESYESSLEGRSVGDEPVA